MQAGELTVGEPPLVHEYIHEEFSLGMDHWREAQRAFSAAGPIWVGLEGARSPSTKPAASPSPLAWEVDQARGVHEERLRFARSQKPSNRTHL